MKMNVNSNKVICPDFIRNVLDGYRDDNDDLPLVYPAMNLPPCQLQDLPCLIIVLILLEFIISLIESACPILLLPNPDPLLRKFFEASSDIYMRLESIICEKSPPLLEVTNHLQRIWRNVDVELDK